jgi:hypothetical protein
MSTKFWSENFTGSWPFGMLSHILENNINTNPMSIGLIMW